MNRLEKRLLKLEKMITKYNYPIMFFVFINNGIYQIIKNGETSPLFNSEDEMLNYIIDKYPHQEYKFFTLDITNTMKSK